MEFFSFLWKALTVLEILREKRQHKNNDDSIAYGLRTKDFVLCYSMNIPGTETSKNKKPKRLENSQLLRKTWNVILEQCVANYDREIIS